MNNIEHVKELAEKYIPNSINGIELTTTIAIRKMLIPKRTELALDIIAVNAEFEGSIMRCRFPQPVDETVLDDVPDKFFKEESERIVKQLLCRYIKNLINYTEEK